LEGVFEIDIFCLFKISRIYRHKQKNNDTLTANTYTVMNMNSVLSRFGLSSDAEEERPYF